MVKQATVLLKNIHVNENFGLRRANIDSESFQGLVASIREKGPITSLTVRPYKDEKGNVIENEFELIDGLQRLTAATQLGLKEFPVTIHDMDNESVLMAQILTNIHKIETRPVEYTQQLKRIMGLTPTMTRADLARKLGKSTQWVDNRLSIDKIIDPKIQELIDSGKINVASAYALAKLPPEEQPTWVSKAVGDPQAQFVEAVNQRVREIRNERRKGKDAAPPKFEAVPHLRTMRDIKSEAESMVAFKKLAPKTPQEAWTAAFNWIRHLDPESVALAEKKWNEDRAKAEEAKAQRKAERDAKKAEAAVEAQAAVQVK